MYVGAVLIGERAGESTRSQLQSTPVTPASASARVAVTGSPTTGGSGRRITIPGSGPSVTVTVTGDGTEWYGP